MNTEKTIKIINELYEDNEKLHEQSLYETSLIAIKLIQHEARKILMEDDGLNEFIMAMGTCFFTYKEGSKYDMNSYDDDLWEKWAESDDYVRAYRGIIYDDDFHPEFFSMIEDFNYKFSVKGAPMRFTATSTVVTDWTDKPVIHKERIVK